MRTSPDPGGGPAVDRWLGPALRTVDLVAILTVGTAAQAEPVGASAAPGGDGRPRAAGDAAVIDLQRQVNDLRSELLDERERRIARWQEANAFVLVLLGIAIGIGGLWAYAKFRSIADQASIGAAAARRYVPVPRGRLSVAAVSREPPTDGPGPLLPYLVAARPESTPVSSARAAATGSTGSSVATPGNAVAPAGQPDPGLDPEELQRHEEAIADCSEAIRLDPRNPALYLERAEARSAVARCDEAIADYGRAIRLDPDHAGAYLGRRRAKSELGRHEEAVEDDDRAVGLDPDSVAAIVDG